MARSPAVNALNELAEESYNAVLFISYSDASTDHLRSNFDGSASLHLAAGLMPYHQRSIRVLHNILRCIQSNPIDNDVSKVQWKIPCCGLAFSMSFCLVTKSFIGLSKYWRHDNRLMAIHVRDKPQKLVISCFLPNSAPAFLTELILLGEQEGNRSGLCGCVLDMSDCSQNISVLHKCHPLKSRMPFLSTCKEHSAQPSMF
jgi:hypothetical protein